MLHIFANLFIEFQRERKNALNGTCQVPNYSFHEQLCKYQIQLKNIDFVILNASINTQV